MYPAARGLSRADVSFPVHQVQPDPIAPARLLSVDDTKVTVISCVEGRVSHGLSWVEVLVGIRVSVGIEVLIG